MATYHQQMQKIFELYTDEVTAEPADLRTVAAWALRKGLWSPQPSDVHARFAADMADALREEFRTDSSGRRYRTKHAVRQWRDGRQQSFWADIDIAPRAHMEKAFSQRRRQIVADCHHLRLDVDHFNAAHSTEAPIQLILDFTEDVEEILILEGIEDAAA
tara:strand:- start:11270 stop:11749 length:480 start_codon:yes stop_codon:yes gene_type:complete